MNQILFVPNDYQEDNIKKTKKVRKRLFIVPLILSIAIGISSYKIYAMGLSKAEEKDNNLQVSKTSINVESNNIQQNIENSENNEAINNESNNSIKEETKTIEKTTKTNKYKASNGKTYEVIANLNIPSLGIEYPVLSSTSEALLKISLNKYWGANPNEVGNMCIVGHNYEDSRFFGKLNKIKKGAIVKITDLNGETLDYEVYDKYVVGPYDTDCTSQLTNGKTEITLITCHQNGAKRFVVKARAKI